jgi:hypothetical protein
MEPSDSRELLANHHLKYGLEVALEIEKGAGASPLFLN